MDLRQITLELAFLEVIALDLWPTAAITFGFVQKRANIRVLARIKLYFDKKYSFSVRRLGYREVEKYRVSVFLCKDLQSVTRMIDYFQAFPPKRSGFSVKLKLFILLTKREHYRRAGKTLNKIRANLTIISPTEFGLFRLLRYSFIMRRDKCFYNVIDTALLSDYLPRNFESYMRNNYKLVAVYFKELLVDYIQNYRPAKKRRTDRTVYPFIEQKKSGKNKALIAECRPLFKKSYVMEPVYLERLKTFFKEVGLYSKDYLCSAIYVLFNISVFKILHGEVNVSFTLPWYDRHIFFRLQDFFMWCWQNFC